MLYELAVEERTMFFMMGITEGRKDLDYSKMIICDVCGQYGRYMVYMTYTVLSLFFIPVFKWNRQYFVQTSCCGTVYSLDQEKGRSLERGENVDIEKTDLTMVQRGSVSRTKVCPSCGYRTDEDFEYCPKCGQRLG